MTSLKRILVSTRTMTVLLLLYGISMAVATFVENDYDTPTAKTLVYNSTWFEILMLWLIVLFVANIKTYRLLRREKWPILIFHVAFIFMFIGGAITRYISFEGQMPIKENQTTNEIISDLTYFKLVVTDGKKTLRYDKYPYTMSYFNAKETKWPFKRTYERDYRFGNKIISLKTLDYIPLAKDSIQANEKGEMMLKIVSVGQGGRVNNYISEGEIKNIDGSMFSFNNPVQGAIQLIEKDDELTIVLPTDGRYISMEGQQMGIVTDSILLAQRSGIIKGNEPAVLNNRALYTINNTGFIIPENAFKGKIVYYRGDKNIPMDKNRLEVIQLELASGNERDTILIKGGKGVTGFDKT